VGYSTSRVLPYYFFEQVQEQVVQEKKVQQVLKEHVKE
jgi:hypothetical protein